MASHADMVTFINQELDPDLADIVDASEVAVSEQYKLAVGGYRTLRRFACLGADVAEARTELKAEVGYAADPQQDPDLHRKERLGLAMLTDAWKAAQCHVERENATRAEAKSNHLPVPVAPTTRVAMRKAIEALPSIGRITDREAPGAQYLSQKMEEVEQHMPTASPLDEIVSVDDNDDYQLGPALDPSGAFRVVRKKMKVALPSNNEGLRLRLRVEGYTWMCLATKFPSRKWLAGQQQVCWERYVDYILGPTVASLPIREIRGSEMVDTGRTPPILPRARFRVRAPEARVQARARRWFLPHGLLEAGRSGLRGPGAPLYLPPCYGRPGRVLRFRQQGQHPTEG